MRAVATCLLILALPFLFDVPVMAESDESGERPVILIMDASGSMAEAMGGVTRMAVARKILRQHLGRLGKLTPVGLVAYGNKIPGCRSHRLYSRVQSGNQKTILSQVDRMVPAGATPLTATLKLVEETLLPRHPGANIVIISDGAESCGRDPARLARKLREKYSDISINVLGLQVKRDARIQLEGLAAAGGGSYHQIERPDDFALAFQRTLGVRTIVPPARVSPPRPGRMGDWREPEEPYIVTDPARMTPPREEPRRDESRHGDHDEHGSYTEYNHPR